MVLTMEYVANPEMAFHKRIFSNLKDAFAYFGHFVLPRTPPRAITKIKTPPRPDGGLDCRRSIEGRPTIITVQMRTFFNESARAGELLIPGTIGNDVGGGLGARDTTSPATRHRGRGGGKTPSGIAAEFFARESRKDSWVLRASVHGTGWGL